MSKFKISIYNPSFVFIFINILVAFFGFTRSFAFMKFFNFQELGVITLVSTAASLIGFFQIGLINGGYRIIALKKTDLSIKTNNVIFSFFGVLSIILFTVSIFGYFLGFFSDGLILIVINVLGISILINNWLTNTLIGGSEFKRLNIANFFSGLASLLCLVVAYYFGLYGALLSLMIQPILFVLLVFISDRKELPSKFDLDLKYVKYILSFGFIPFISGIFFIMYQQVERWSVTFFLGVESLGKMYLVFLTTTLWLLIPMSINSLFFPKAVKFFENGNMDQLKKTVNQYFLILILYSTVGVILIILIFPPLVELLFPNHYSYINLVFLILPGLFFRNMCDPIVLLLNSMVKLKPILYSDIISVFFYCLMLKFLSAFNFFSLENIIICYVLYSFIKFLYLLVVLLVIKKNQY